MYHVHYVVVADESRWVRPIEAASEQAAKNSLLSSFPAFSILITHTVKAG